MSHLIAILADRVGLQMRDAANCQVGTRAVVLTSDWQCGVVIAHGCVMESISEEALVAANTLWHPAGLLSV